VDIMQQHQLIQDHWFRRDFLFNILLILIVNGLLLQLMVQEFNLHFLTFQQQTILIVCL